MSLWLLNVEWKQKYELIEPVPTLFVFVILGGRMDGETRGDRSKTQNTNQNSCCNNISGGIRLAFLIVGAVDDNVS